MPRQTIAERLAEKSRRLSSGCLEWTDALSAKGYGKLRIPNEKGWLRAHRASWIEAYGPIPAGQFVCHKCDNPSCVEPTHLFLGTTDDNMADMVRKGRSRTLIADRRRGENNSRAKITSDAALEIIVSREPHRIIAERFGISRTTVSEIKSRRRWGHLEVPG